MVVAAPADRLLEAAPVCGPAARGGDGRHAAGDDARPRVLHEKATAWLYVAGGAFLIALKETYELVEGHEWPTAVFWVLVVVMFGIAAVNTAVRMSRTHQLVANE